jgi:hypothetical protein
MGWMGLTGCMDWESRDVAHSYHYPPLVGLESHEYLIGI